MKAPEGLAGLAAREAGHLEEPPPADARMLAMANRALSERVAELEAQAAHLRGERAAVVAYLLTGTCDCRECMDAAVVRLAREIERGEHRRDK